MMEFLGAKLKDYKELMKFNLSLLVLFSSLIAYLIVPAVEISVLKILSLLLGGFLVTAAANATNEWIERESDKLMKRTKDRPIPTRRMEKEEVYTFIGGSLIVGLIILFTQFNLWAAGLALLSYLIYAFVYTPMKRKSPFSVLVGAIPGALPCLIGWAAGAGTIWGMDAWVLFGFQFFWQFPHFWAIAWLAHDDYKKAGLKMLPQENKEGRFTAFQTVFYTSMLIPLAGLPYVLGMTSLLGTAVLALAALGFVYFALQFYKYNSDEKARKLMFASFAYLPLILVTFLIDSFI